MTIFDEGLQYGTETIANTESQLILEKKFQQFIDDEPYVKSSIAEILLSNNSPTYKFVREVEYINGITSDFTILDEENKKIIGTLECKRPDIGVTEFVRGIGQSFQYEYFAENKIKPRKYSSYDYSNNLSIERNNAIVIPSEFYKNTKLNIAKFKYPKSTILIEVNLKNHNVREINDVILKNIGAQNNNLIAISSYYFRDNRIFEFYILLKYIAVKQALLSDFINRKSAEQDLQKLETPNKRNWRNAFITLSNLNFIDSSNLLTISGNKLNNMNLVQFTSMLYTDYLKNYVDEIMELFEEKPESLKMSNQEIADLIKEKYNGKDILYLTQSNGRYISSWLNIMRDDLGCITFKSRSRDREIRFIPSQLNIQALEEKIDRYSSGNTYVERFEKAVKGKEYF